MDSQQGYWTNSRLAAYTTVIFCLGAITGVKVHQLLENNIDIVKPLKINDSKDTLAHSQYIVPNVK